MDDQQLRISSRPAGAGVELRLEGELDAHTVGSFLTEARAGLAAHEDVGIDAQGLSFVDSSGLRALIAIRQEAERSGRSVELRAASSQLQRLLELTGLHDLLPSGNRASST